MGQADKYGDKIACYYRDVVDVVEETKTTVQDGKEVEKTWK
jgi:long-chain acyl-CoA synthetase